MKYIVTRNTPLHMLVANIKAQCRISRYDTVYFSGQQFQTVSELIDSVDAADITLRFAPGAEQWFSVEHAFLVTTSE